ncbi:bifunctional Heat shock protein Sti1-like/STI1 domain/Tetratricopeptide repeat 2/Tetratricopeptide repeat/Tetratricopeptide-like helical domain superfamily/Tetratricopeptide repeat 1/Heat shock chaperonin-binding [Babesia duncani]|uniref:Hsp70-Hsp90 organising protein n=1 Tax=Babesia duncani TaxID=323732 RepID=A0AAD9PJX1_9APIC|nr:bifunctional Heat shock protein Sti1-like/STI1 domain/Tetratricopeptide repeat 2/Tetratricopeptide repeat/Tetratricopeptide-like helical domain superfamily/Tetratricopeptide repeat 1/Heat shock chaperonin-binding [Babesia duncani]
MSDWKQKGNEAFKAGNFAEALNCFTEAINLNPGDGILYSNRSGAYASLGMFKEALEDANKCIELKPDWPKGYSRKGLAEYKLGDTEAAKATYKLGLQIDPNNEPLKNALREVETDFSVGYMQAFMAITQAIKTNPKLAEYQRQDPTYSQKVAKAMVEMTSNPQNLQSILMDPNPALREGLLACMGMPTDMPDKRPPEPEPRPQETFTKQPPKTPDATMSSLSPTQMEAEQHKNKGNECYKKRQFTEALNYYDKAIGLDPTNLLYENNKAAVYLEMGEYDKCIATCEKAIERRYDVKADFTVIGKYDKAIEAYQKALLEDNNRQTRAAMKEVERIKEKKEREAYIDVDLAEKHKETGNEHFRNFNFPEAKREYDEAIRRNPSDPKLYSNRAASLLKLGEYPSALADCNKATEMDPTFVKAWARKGTLHMLLKEYHKAIEAYDRGLSIDPNSPECLNGKADCIARIQSMSQSDTVDEEQVKHAMADPEVQRILGDVQFQLILKRISENPASMYEYMQDPKIAQGIEKLIAAGIIRTR